MADKPNDDVIVLTDENGEEHEFSVVDVLEVEGKEYAVLLPSVAADQGEEEAIILRVESDENGNEVLVDIEDDAEFERVAEAWDEMMAEECEDDEDDRA